MDLIQIATSSAASTPTTMDYVFTFAPLVILVIVFYFFMLRPQKKRQKQEQEMRNALQVGDEVVTIGGIIGRVVSIKDETILIETGSDRAKIRIQRWAVQSVTPLSIED